MDKDCHSCSHSHSHGTTPPLPPTSTTSSRIIQINNNNTNPSTSHTTQTHSHNGPAISSLVNILSKSIDLCIRGMGPVMVSIAWFFFLAVSYAFFAHILPAYQWEVFSIKWNFFTVIGLFLLFNLFYNHMMCVFTSPGTIPDSIPVPDNIQLLLSQERSARRGDHFSLYCRKCLKKKPPRTHHCQICKKCILKMDHHCPWVANCVGFNNHRFFVLFLFYLCIGALYIVFLTFPIVIWGSPASGVQRVHHTVCLFVLILCGATFFADGAMLVLHLYLIGSNQSTIELYYNRNQKFYMQRYGEIYKNPYDLGYKKNFQNVFGIPRYYYLSWILPMKVAVGDGLSFTTRDDDENEDLDVKVNANLSLLV